MGFLTDLLKDIPLSAVLKERFAIAEKEIETLKSENTNFKHLVSQKDQEIERLSQKIQALEKMHNIPQLTFIAPFYYAVDDPTPFCPTCWEANKTQIHLLGPSSTSVGPKYTCTHCKNTIIHPRTKSSLLISGISG